jgi:hypothetical protein
MVKDARVIKEEDTVSCFTIRKQGQELSISDLHNRYQNKSNDLPANYNAESKPVHAGSANYEVFSVLDTLCHL